MLEVHQRTSWTCLELTSDRRMDSIVRMCSHWLVHLHWTDPVAGEYSNSFDRTPGLLRLELVSLPSVLAREKENAAYRDLIDNATKVSF